MHEAFVCSHFPVLFLLRCHRSAAHQIAALWTCAAASTHCAWEYAGASRGVARPAARLHTSLEAAPGRAARQLAAWACQEASLALAA